MAIADDLIGQFDRALKTLAGGVLPRRPNPAAALVHSELSSAEAEHAAGLMRVNHTGEICAQALYEGQALTARDRATRTALEAAAQEESDHLAWCQQRLEELGSRPSLLNPAFYALSYAMGAVTGLLGDKVSLGFVEATEDQVCRHLERHLQSLPEDDVRSREIVQHMHEDEARHGADAIAAGGVAYPQPIRQVMALLSKVMTETTYRV